jgi:hypothetical protein
VITPVGILLVVTLVVNDAPNLLKVAAWVVIGIGLVGRGFRLTQGVTLRRDSVTIHNRPALTLPRDEIGGVAVDGDELRVLWGSSSVKVPGLSREQVSTTAVRLSAWLDESPD